MIASELHKPAIRAIERLISVARFLALQERSADSLAEMLDQMSYLPQLLLDQEERTNDFVRCLQQLAKSVPESELALREFQMELGKA